MIKKVVIGATCGMVAVTVAAGLIAGITAVVSSFGLPAFIVLFLIAGAIIGGLEAAERL